MTTGSVVDEVTKHIDTENCGYRRLMPSLRASRSMEDGEPLNAAVRFVRGGDFGESATGFVRGMGTGREVPEVSAVCSSSSRSSSCC